MKKKILAGFIVTVLMAGLCGCGGSNTQTSTSTSVSTSTESSVVTSVSVSVEEKVEKEDKGETTGTILVEIFKDEMGKGTAVSDVVDKLVASSGFDCGVMEVSEGFLNGFSAEVKGFSSGLTFGPYIGSIPFVGYVFETDDTAALVETLTSLADPRWNICTAAEETVIEVSGNYVFFAMCPGDDF